MSYAPLIGVAIAGSIVALYAVSGAERTQEAQQVQFDAQVADDASAAADALSNFLTPRQAAYIASYGLETPNTVITLPWATIQNAISDAPSATNRLGQTLSVVIRAKTGFDADGNGVSCDADTGELCALDAYVVYDGGSTLPDARLAAVANRVTGGRGGGIFSVLRISAVTAPNVYDAAGGATWTVTRGEFNPSPWPAAGRPMTRVVIGGSSSETTSLSRYPHPTRNTLHTDINAAGCDDPSTGAIETTAGCHITNAGDVTLATGQSLAGAVFKPYTAADGAILTKPTCPAGTSPDAVTGIERAVLDNVGTPNNGARGWLENSSATTWTARIRFSTALGEVAPADPSYARISVHPFCS